MADLDIKTSKNIIGETINASQIIGTMIWNAMSNESTYDDIKDMYLDVCMLSIISNVAIDLAKKEFVVDIGKELRSIKAKYKLKGIDDKSVQPYFFSHIAKQKGYYNPDRKEYRKFKTSMDYLQECVNSYNASRKGKVDKNNFLPFSDVVNRRRFRYEYVNDKTVYEVLTGAEELHNNIIRIMSDATLSSEEQRARVRERKQEYTEKIGEWDFNTHTMIALLQAIEKEENKQYQRLLFYSLFGYPNTSFYRVIKESVEKLPEIQECDTGNLTIYGKHFC